MKLKKCQYCDNGYWQELHFCPYKKMVRGVFNYAKKHNLTYNQAEKVMYLADKANTVIVTEHSEQHLPKSYIKLSPIEKRLLCQKGSLVGTDAKEPEKGLCDYVEKLINQYISKYQMHGKH